MHAVYFKNYLVLFFKELCAVKKSGIFKHEDPYKFVVCMMGRYFVLDCPAGTRYHDDTEMCEEEEEEFWNFLDEEYEHDDLWLVAHWYNEENELEGEKCFS